MLGKPRIRLNNLKTSLRFPCLGLNPIIDSINLIMCLCHISFHLKSNSTSHSIQSIQFNHSLNSFSLLKKSFEGHDMPRTVHTHYNYNNLIWRIVSRRVDISKSKYHTRRKASSVMLKIWKYPQDMIQCVRSSYCIDNLLIIYIFRKRNTIFKVRWE